MIPSGLGDGTLYALLRPLVVAIPLPSGEWVTLGRYRRVCNAREAQRRAPGSAIWDLSRPGWVALK